MPAAQSFERFRGVGDVTVLEVQAVLLRVEVEGAMPA
jgi:hypothetical protein